MPLLDVLVNDRRINDETLANLFAERLKLPRLRLAAAPPDPDVARRVDQKLARRHLCIPLRLDGRSMIVAMANPLSPDAQADIEFATGARVTTVVASRSEVIDAIEEIYEGSERLNDLLGGIEEDPTITVFGDPADEREAQDGDAGATAVVKFCNLVLAEAVKAGASDIHIEPESHDLKIRLRVDGVLRDFLQAPKWLQNPIISRFKILAKLDISEKRVPQDGRIKVDVRGTTRDLRVSTLPTHYGEKIVLRLLGASRAPSLEALGFNDQQRQAVDGAIFQPQGMVLITGPTGSGKTTSLYAMMMQRQSREVNIVTVEDPIEYELPGMTQVQVNVKAGMTFAAGLRAILRQDPDVILVGEIRDGETAQIALQAAMTGHLVLSTLHTNSAVAAIPRLLDLGADPFAVASSLSLVIAQRLVRRICPHCAVSDTASAEAAVRLQLPRNMPGLKRGAGCNACWNTGYAGRLAISEALRVTAAVRQVIQRRGTEAELKRAAVEGGFKTLLQDGIEKLGQGLTTADELLRGLQLQDEDMVRCAKCLAVLDPEFATCPFCLTARQRACDACGAPLKPEWIGCPYCRSPQTTALPAAAAPSLPLESQPVVAPSKPTLLPPPTKIPTVLVVDDDDDIRRVVRVLLGRLPYPVTVREAVSGEEALVAVSRDNVDMVVLDLGLPGLDGFGVCERLRSDMRTAFIPVLMLTANANESNRLRGFLVGTDDFVAKPFSPVELSARVTRLLRRTYGV